MNPLKSEAKIETAHTIGCRLDDALEALQKEQLKFEGASQGLAQAAQAIEALTQHVDKDIDEEQFDLQVGGHIKKYLIRASQVAINLSKQADNNRLLTLGKTLAMETSVKIVKKVHDEEVTKAENYKKAVDTGVLVPDNGSAPAATLTRDDIRPGNLSLKEQRLAEEAAETARTSNGASGSSGSSGFEVTPDLDKHFGDKKGATKKRGSAKKGS